MEKAKKQLIYFLVILLNYYVLPLFILDTGSGMFFLLFLMPLICLAASVVYGVKNGFTLWIPLAAAVLFVPSIFLFYNISAWVYSAGYGVLALLGNGIGSLFHKK